MHGWSVGVGGVSAAFGQAIKAVGLIQSCLNSRETDPEFLALKYQILRTRLEQWGLYYCGDESRPDQLSELLHKPKSVQNLILGILKQIESLKEDANIFVAKHNISLSTPEPFGSKTHVKDKNHQNAKSFMRKMSDFKLKLNWVEKDRDALQATLDKLNDLVTNLEAFLPGCHLPSSALTASILPRITNTRQLETLAGSGDKINMALATSARAKAIMDTSESYKERNASRIVSQNLTLAEDSRFGILRMKSNLPLSVLIEWNFIKATHGAEEYIKRIQSLAYVLERASSSELCLPPCHGFFEDVAYERLYGMKRIGLVFGVPIQGTDTFRYDGDLECHPPKTLADLIQAEKSAPIPLLGDRFQLALELVTTFNCFHAAGWLHKGINPHSILFFQRTEKQGVNITKPFITGFQFSRPQDGASLSQGPLEDSKYDQYYHPDARSGFTKSLDLYGLGVVLCEIGQWKLMANRVVRQRKAVLANRSAWRDFMLDNVVADIGWRMGKHYQSAVRALLCADLPSDRGDEIFAQQYLERVIRPLSMCVA
ncbi:prion-inhibition and propagation domain-containing protein [Trichoderma chlorosporum]